MNDKSCPRLQKQLLAVYPDRAIFHGYFSERIAGRGILFKEYGDKETININNQFVENSVSLTQGSNIATKILSPKNIDWSKTIKVTIKDNTSIKDIIGNLACSDIIALTTDKKKRLNPNYIDEDEITENNINLGSNKGTTTEQEDKINLISATIVETAGEYTIGKSLTLTAKTSLPVDEKSILLVELAGSKKRVFMKPISDNSDTMLGKFIITKDMISDKPLKIGKIVAVNLIDNSNPENITSSIEPTWLKPTSSKYSDNIGDKKIIIVDIASKTVKN